MAPHGAALQDLLFAHGVEFPCGGRARCKGCRVKVIEGAWTPTAEEERLLSPREREEGWRLICRGKAERDLKLELAQWETTILEDDLGFEFTPKEGLGIAVDLGTTTVVAQLVDLENANVLGVRSVLNAQARYGADIMSRIEFGLQERGARRLREVMRDQIGGMIADLVDSAPNRRAEFRDVVIVGNTIMHHLFCGLSVEPLSRHPFDFLDGGWKSFSGRELGWALPEGGAAHFLPCLGSFVGSDLLAGMMATNLHQAKVPVALVDLGTNGEIIFCKGDQLLCASTAAGPAFEGARISAGMRASTGAISEVAVSDGGLKCHVLGNVTARGICGSGLVDATAGALELGWVKANGRFHGRDKLALSDFVSLTQADIRELQLAKGAIAAGLELLANAGGSSVGQMKRVYLAGAFGNYINLASARRIGLLNMPAEKIEPVGNTALRGAKMALFDLESARDIAGKIRKKIRHVSLNEDPAFQEIYVEQMAFPG